MGEYGRRQAVDRNPASLLPDKGCKYHPSCLSCPAEVCHYDDPIAFHRARRDGAIADAVAAGLSTAGVIAALGISRRTMIRWTTGAVARQAG